MQRLNVIMIPKCTGSIPYCMAIGRKIGVKIRMAGVASSGIPMISRTTIMISRTTTCCR